VAKAPPIATGRLLSLRLFSTPLILRKRMSREKASPRPEQVLPTYPLKDEPMMKALIRDR
jgi:hypothetical protein